LDFGCRRTHSFPAVVAADENLPDVDMIQGDMEGTS